jgi:hypothetical protein
MRNGLELFVSRRDWLNSAWAVAVGTAGTKIGLCTETTGQKSGLIYHHVMESAPWSARGGLGCVVFQRRLWVMGGTGNAHNGTQSNDVWSSEDGRQWRQELASAPWQPRWAHHTFAFADKLWVIGGLASVEPIHNLNDIWSSPDGKEWTREVADAPWPARHRWQAAGAIHRNRIYLIAGAADGHNYYQDVWCSDDGVHWRSAPVQGPWFERRKDHAVASFRGRLYLAGGTFLDAIQPGGGRRLNDVWSSLDGRVWDCVARHASWAPRVTHNFVVYHGRLWLVGGAYGRPYATDIWSTADGVDWRQETSHIAWTGRHAEGVVAFQNKVWIVGGTSDSWVTTLNDVWTFEEDQTGVSKRSELRLST